MPAYYPAYLHLAGRECLVVGGGPVGERKVRGLLDAGARVKLVAPQASTGLQEMAKGGAIEWLPRRYRSQDLHGVWLVVVAVSDSAVSHQVSQDASAARIFVNVADEPPLCTFIAPAVARAGEVSVAIATNGKSPAAARRLREELEREWLPQASLLVELAAEVRAVLLGQGLRPSPEQWNAALGSKALRAAIKTGNMKMAKERLLEGLSTKTTIPG